MADRLRALVTQVSIPPDRILGVGVAMPGPFLTREKKIVLPVNFPQWQNSRFWKGCAKPTISGDCGK